MSPTFLPGPLHGKVAFVAGGTRGLNLSIAERLTLAGASVAVASRDGDRCAQAAASLQALGVPGVRALGLPLDVRDEEQVNAALQRTAGELGAIDFVVAGQAGNFFAPANGISAKGFRAVVDTDLVGTFNLFRGAWPHLRRPGASLLAISAPQAVRPLSMQAHACAAKAGVNMLVRCLALEWGAAGVRVNAISPGPIENTVGMDKATGGDPALAAQVAGRVPLGRWGTHRDVADAALFLLSDAASYITGTILDVDGGIGVDDGQPRTTL